MRVGGRGRAPHLRAREWPRRRHRARDDAGRRAARRRYREGVLGLEGRVLCPSSACENVPAVFQDVAGSS